MLKIKEKFDSKILQKVHVEIKTPFFLNTSIVCLADHTFYPFARRVHTFGKRLKTNTLFLDLKVHF
ncbi:hypothetical protein LEP1GSC046_1159 [Leptospira kirschneri serovar Bim str. 1051]|nr:hypothetical protein LEP1GSC046_1159 [Leptospira kirschneri serovar Bim str. 1051]